MQTLRNAKSLTRLLLVWFALAIGAAIASPVIKPQTLEMICSAGGLMKLQPASDDGTAAHPVHTLDCPLCAFTGAPPPVAGVLFEERPPQTCRLTPIAAAHIASRTAAALPARGPPVLLN